MRPWTGRWSAWPELVYEHGPILLKLVVLLHDRLLSAVEETA